MSESAVSLPILINRDKGNYKTMKNVQLLITSGAGTRQTRNPCVAGSRFATPHNMIFVPILTARHVNKGYERNEKSSQIFCTPRWRNGYCDCLVTMQESRVLASLEMSKNLCVFHCFTIHYLYWTKNLLKVLSFFLVRILLQTE